ncbi:MAG TPA: hypothetical protein VMA73_27990 [Streptosporangiaceae bacterium]|nr:hypothetical protein [Streptosporangiaceae bacterium]
MLGAELAAADDGAVAVDAGLLAGDAGDAGLLAAGVLSAVGVDGLFDEDAAAAMMAIAPTAMNPESTLCRTGQGFRFGARCGGTGGCSCQGGADGGYCWSCGRDGSP